MAPTAFSHYGTRLFNSFAEFEQEVLPEYLKAPDQFAMPCKDYDESKFDEYMKKIVDAMNDCTSIIDRPNWDGSKSY